MNQKATEKDPKPLSLFSIQAPFACHCSFLPPPPPAIPLHPTPVPHCTPQFFPWSSVLCSSIYIYSTCSCLALFPRRLSPSSTLAFLTLSLYHPLFFSLYFFFLSLAGHRHRAPTNVTRLSPLVPRTGAVPGIHKK